MEFIKSSRQNTWGWPAIANFILGGTGAGLYLNLYGIRFSGFECPPGFDSGILFCLSPLMMGLGFLAVALEAGRPWRARFSVLKVRRSWMSREALAAAGFWVAMILAYLEGHAFWWHFAAVAGLAFAMSQGFMVYRARGIPAWNHPAIPCLFITSAFATGAGLMLAILGARSTPLAHQLPIIVALSAGVFEALLWVLYVWGSKDPEFRRATASLRSRGAMIFHLGLLRILPIGILAVVGFQNHRLAGPHPIGLAAATAGWLALSAGATQKVAIIRQSGFFRPITLDLPMGRTHVQNSSPRNP